MLTVTQKPTIKDFSYSRRFVRGIAQKSLAPLLLLECFVTGGRTIQAYKRGGFEEARERFTEESIGAAFWFAGVKMFNKMNDCIGKRILKLHTADFDADKDGARNPLKNFLFDDKKIKEKAKLEGKTGKLIKNLTEKQIAIFKSLKIGSSIILANVLVGLVVPKINQRITAIYHKKHFSDNKPEQTDEKNRPFSPADVSFNDFLNKNKDGNVSFGMNYPLLLSVANKFENNPKYQLLSTDVGIAGGRTVSSRNNHERVEVLFRDLTSIYFYMFNMPNINRWLNQIEDGRKTRLDPVAAKQVTEHLEALLDENGGKMTLNDFAMKALGNNNNVGYIDKELLELFNKDRIIQLNTFKEFIDKSKKFTKADKNKYIKLAEKMSELQPQIENVSILTKNQVTDIFREGAVNMPEFLRNVYGIATQNQYIDRYKFISDASLNSLKEDIVHYVHKIIAGAEKQGKDITKDLLKKANRENFIKNSLNWGTGFAISAIFLSTLIPKMQYWITKMTTGQNKFPGTADYSNEKKNKKSA